MQRIGIIYSGAGKNDPTRQDITAAFKPHNKQLSFINISSSEKTILSTIKSERLQLLVAAGGDGTVNFTARIALQKKLPMGVIPVGTLNHFAKDVGLPLKLEDAVEVIVAENITQLDYCRVNEHVFVNNSSIGIYPRLVQKREKLQEKIGKWAGLLVASIKVNLASSIMNLSIEIDANTKPFVSPMVFVGNNSYKLEAAGLTNRESLSDGLMCIYVMRRQKFLALMRVAAANLLGRHQAADAFHATTRKEIIIHSKKKSLAVSLDGEVRDVGTPLRYRLIAKGIDVIVPKS